MAKVEQIDEGAEGQAAEVRSADGIEDTSRVETHAAVNAPEAAKPQERKFKDTRAYRKLFEKGVVTEDGRLKTVPTFIRLREYGLDADGKRYATYSKVFRITSINDYFVDMVRLDNDGTPIVDNNNFGDTESLFWETLDVSLETSAEWDKRGKIEERKLENTKAYAALKQHGLINDLGELVHKPLYIRAEWNGPIVYRIEALGPYYAQLTFVEHNRIVSSAQAATNAQMWERVIGEATEAEWLKGK